jgi:hypothetical protein
VDKLHELGIVHDRPFRLHPSVGGGNAPPMERELRVAEETRLVVVLVFKYLVQHLN